MFHEHLEFVVPFMYFILGGLTMAVVFWATKPQLLKILTDYPLLRGQITDLQGQVAAKDTQITALTEQVTQLQQAAADNQPVLDTVLDPEVATAGAAAVAAIPPPPAPPAP